MDNSTIIVWGINTLLSIRDRKTRTKISKKVEDLNNAKFLLCLTDIYSIIYPATLEYTFSGGY